MALREIQKQVDEWIKQYPEGYWSPHVVMTQLQEEAGEVAREVMRRFGPKRPKADDTAGDLDEEIGDCIFTLCCLANPNGIDLDEAFAKTMAKRYGRDRDRFPRHDAH